MVDGLGLSLERTDTGGDTRYSLDVTTVATVLEPAVRPRLDAAAQGYFAAVHADTLPDAIRAVRERPVHAVLLSPGVIPAEQLREVDALVRGFPGVPAVAVLTKHDPASAQRLLELGACGVRRLVDLSVREGWRRLRDLVAQPISPTAALILGAVMPALGDVPPDCHRFFEVIVRLGPRLPSVRAVARYFQVRPSTFMSRFFRSGLPSPKRYLGAMRLVHAAALLEVNGLSITDVAYRLEYSSPQSFGRHIRTVVGLTAGEFRARYTLNVALEDYTKQLIVPFRAVFRTFHPLDNWVAETGQEE